MLFRSTVAALLSAATLCFATAALAARPAPNPATDAADRTAAWELHQKLESESAFAGLPWRSVGPVDQGGRLIDIEVHPEQPYTFYVAFASGGLWRTTNNGQDFEPLFDDQPTMIMGDVALDPNDPQTIWVGTGENNSSRSSYSGMGVFRSTDGGETFEHMGLTDTDRIGRILVDPRDSKRVLVAVLGRLYTPTGERGIFLTEDAGKNWRKVQSGETDWTGFIDMVRDPSNPDVLFAAAWDRSRRPWNFVEGGTGSGVYKSTDAGTSWERAGDGLPSGPQVGRIGLTICRDEPSVMYAYVDNQELLAEKDWDLGDSAITPKRMRNMSKEDFLAQDPEAVEDFVRSYDLHPSIDGPKLTEMIENDEIAVEELVDSLNDANASLFNTDIRGAQVWRSTNSGRSWKLAHADPIRDLGYTYGYYFGTIRVAPDDPDRLYIMGVPMARSDDGGKTWRGIDKQQMHVDHQSMWIDGDNSQRILSGNDGGLAASYDGGESWLVLNSIAVGQFYTVAVDMAEPYHIYGGLQDNGTWKGSSLSEVGDAWSRVGGGDGMYVQIDSRDDATVYSGFQFGYYGRSGPDGNHRVRPRNELKDPPLRYNWQTPILLSSHNQDIVYFGANKMFRSMDKGETWTALSDDLTRSENRGDVPFGTIATLDESTFRFGLLWAGTDDGYVHVSEDGGHTWKDVSDGLPSDRWVSRIESSIHNERVAYVTLNGYRNDDMTAYVYRTEDLGTSWQSIAAGIPAEPVNVIREDPEAANVLYVGTDRGVYVTTDIGASWSALQGGLPNTPVHDLVVHPRDGELVAGTHGRSVWVVDVVPIQQLDDEVRAADVHLYDLDEVQAQRWWRGRNSRWFYDDDDAPTTTFTFWSARGGKAKLTVLDADDRELQTVSFDAIVGMNAFEWNLRLDRKKAIDAEKKRVREEDRKTREDGETVETKGAKARTPWAEAFELGWPLYITGGEYKVRIEIRGQSDEQSLTVKAPPARDPRMSAPATRPGKLHP